MARNEQCSHHRHRAVTASDVVAIVASTRVMEKCGMHRGGTRWERWEKFGEPIDLVRYTLRREVWQG